MGNVNTQSPAILRKESGASKVGYKNSADGAFARTLQEKLEEFLSVKDFGMVEGVGANSTVNSVRLLNAISALRRNSVTILQEIGGANITAYSSGTIFFPAGVWRVDKDALDFAVDMGLTLKGAGSKGTNNAIQSPTTLLIAGTGDGFGIRVYGAGARNLRVQDMAICYEDQLFTGDVIDSYSSPGLILERAFVGTFGITAGTRYQSARSLVRATYDEFNKFFFTVFDGANWGWWSDDTRGDNTFGGSMTSFETCTFYDFTDSHIKAAGNRTRAQINIGGSTTFNPISVSSARCIDVNNVDGFNMQGCKFAGSTSESATVEWAKIYNCTGTIHGNTFNDFSKAGTLAGMLDVRGNVIYCNDGFQLKGGVITGGANEFSKCTNAWLVTEPDYPLTVSLEPDHFKNQVTTSYYFTTNTSLLRGKVGYEINNDGSISKFSNAAEGVKIENRDGLMFSVGDAAFEASVFQTGRIYELNGGAAQVVTLPALQAGIELSFFKTSAHQVTVNCPAGKNFYVGEAGARTSAVAGDSVVGAFLKLRSYGSAGWVVVERGGGWVFS